MTPQPPGDVLVSIVVVNYNGAASLGGCLASLTGDADAPALEIIVIDNASADDSAALADEAAARDGRVSVVRSSVNLGYAGAVNLALTRARGHYVAVLNMDIRVEPGWLIPLVALLESRPEAGAACPLIVLESDPGTINAAGQDLHASGLGFNRLLGRPRADAGALPVRLSGLHGGAFMIRREIFDRVGGWDDSGFLYGEDVQLSWLLLLLGADVYCVPASAVSHDYYLTMHPQKLLLLERNRAAMMLSNVRLPTLVLIAPVLLLTELLVWGYCLVRGPRFLKAKLDSYRWTFTRRRSIRARRAFIRELRQRPDRRILRRLRVGYPADQLTVLGRERGLVERRELPVQ